MKVLYLVGGIIAVLTVVTFNISSTSQQAAVATVMSVEENIDLESDASTSTGSANSPTETAVAKLVKPVAQPTQPDSLHIVAKVVDGDTITVTMNGELETIRLIGINTPETVDPRDPIECFGVEASNKAGELLLGRKVRVEKDPTQGDRDKYDRLLAYVFRDDGLFINKFMIEQGYAYEYTYNLPYEYQAEFKAAQSSARSQHRGLWADGVCDQQPAISSPPITLQPQSSTPEPQTFVQQPVTPPSSPQPEPTTSQQPEPPAVAQSDPPPAPPASEPPAPDTSGYSCSTNLYNCTDFKTHAEAQAVYDMCSATKGDIHRLDSDKDGQACEGLP